MKAGASRHRPRNIGRLPVTIECVSEREADAGDGLEMLQVLATFHQHCMNACFDIKLLTLTIRDQSYADVTIARMPAIRATSEVEVYIRQTEAEEQRIGAGVGA